MTSAAPSRLPQSPSRLLVYAVSDRRGDVDDYIPHALTALRPHVDRIIAVVDGGLSAQGRPVLEGVADEIHENVGSPFHLWAYKAAIDALGSALEGYDEVLFSSDAWYGPIHPFGPIFERMDRADVDFWGMTDHGTETPNPFTEEGELPSHIQPHWLAVRARVLASEAWRRFWAEIDTSGDFGPTALLRETALTTSLRAAGFVDAVAFPADGYPTTDPSLLNADLLVEGGCPLLRRRPFADWPPFLDRHAVVGRWTLDAVAAAGFPVGIILQNLARNVPPKVLNADASMLEVLSGVDAAYDRSRPLRIAVVAHIFYEELTAELLDRADNLPEPYDLVVTTPSEAKARAIGEIVAARARRPRSVDIRVVLSNDGRDQSAFFIGCRDVILGDDHDVIVKVHSKKTPQDGYNNGVHFREQQLSNLLDSPGYAANALALFQREPGLGLVFPPMIHIGAATMGRGWAVNKDGFAALADRLGIRVPLDDISPLAPYGAMYIARPEALRLIAREEWRYDEFGGATSYRDGGLAHIIERMPAYAAGELGLHARTIATTEYLSVSHTALDFKLDQISATTMGYSNEQIEFLRRAGFMGEGKLADIAMMHLRLRHPDVDRWLQNVASGGARVGGWFGLRRRTPGGTDSRRDRPIA